MANRLASESSPYLIQHAANPVDWWPWGRPALHEAARLNRPILLSVGYAACHWCHVMAHESFEDADAAALMNALYVNIKVDREERPDIDHIYMSALHEMGEQGGWPLTMFLTPDGQPFWGGTYFPKEARFGRPAFRTVLTELAAIYKSAPDQIEQNRAAIAERLTLTRRRAAPRRAATIDPGELDNVARQIAGAMDPNNGGFRGAPKFPQTPVLEFLLRRNNGIVDEETAKFALVTLDNIALGGIYDHLAGGFSRYSTDERWLIPHFEKMLYDNAQLLDLYTIAFQRTKSDLYRSRIIDTISWLTNEMRLPGGAFASSLDADSEGEEGRYYVWSAHEIQSILGPDDAAFFAAHYDVSDAGNFDGHNIPNLLNRLPQSTADRSRLSMLRGMLHNARSKRIRPATDDKVLADWNGLTIAALIHSATALEQPEWHRLARAAFDFVHRTMSRGDRLGHAWRAGALTYPGLSSDYAAMIHAALALYEFEADAALLRQAIDWQQALEAHHADPDSGGYFLSADDAEALILRPLITADDAVANPHSLIAQNLIRLSVYTGDDAWRQRADRLFNGLVPQAAQSPIAHAGILNALDFRDRAMEIVITGTGTVADALNAAALGYPHLNRIVLRIADAAALPATHPARHTAIDRPAAYVCRNQTCQLPVTDPQALAALLASP